MAFWGFESLTDFYLNGNYFISTIPNIQSGELHDLKELVLYDDFFTGLVPASICDLRDDGDLMTLMADCKENRGLVVIQCDCCTECY
mmetsp:Transcript_16084/g.20020  ORF Transcript_16084/g.20020 Transcript_16084/m.20020 type:complete len:87 (+) Transcript_16084:40-300(+)